MSTPALPLNPQAQRLGYLGLIPFVMGALLAWLVRFEAHPYVMEALSAYAGCVVALLGGIHWGLGMRQGVPSPQPFGWGVVPALVACVAIVMPAYAGLVVHGVMLVVCYLVDRRSYPALGAAAWLNLRFRLSVVASFCCFLAAAST